VVKTADGRGQVHGYGTMRVGFGRQGTVGALVMLQFGPRGWGYLVIDDQLDRIGIESQVKNLFAIIRQCEFISNCKGFVHGFLYPHGSLKYLDGIVHILPVGYKKIDMLE
jgi:hypothetical protein